MSPKTIFEMAPRRARRNLLTLALMALVWVVPLSALEAQLSVAELQIAPSQVELQIGERKSVLVTAFDRDGNVVPTVELSLSTETTVVSIQQDPSAPNVLYLEGVGYGVTSLTVSVGSVSATASVRVADAPGTTGPSGVGVATLLQINPPNIFLLPTEELALGAVFLKDDGTPAARTGVAWRSLLETVASVGSNGKVIGISPGQGVIEARATSGLTARAIVQVQNSALGFAVPRISLSPLQSMDVQVVVPGQSSRPVSSRSVMWTSSDPRVINVSPIGEVTGISPGQADVVVTGFGQQHRLSVVVHRPVELMLVTPQQGEIPVQLGGFSDFEVRFEASDRSVVEEVAAVWVVEDTSIAVVDQANGRVTGKQLGSTTLTVHGPSQEFSATWTLRVITGGLSAGAPRRAMSNGDTTRVVASFMDTEGNVLGEATGIQWTSSDPAVASIDDSGLVTAHAWGHATVVAGTSWGGGDTVEVYVQGDLLVTATTRQGDADIFAVDPDDPNTAVTLTSGTSSEVAPAYSPDGTRIAYAATTEGSTDIFVMNADGSDARRLTETPLNEGSPTWTPDGAQIVYQAIQDRTTYLLIMNADGSDSRQLTTGRDSNDQPAVSPDGQTIAYRSMADRGRNINLMNLDGSNPRRVTDSENSYSYPRWFPDGTLGFITDRRTERGTVRTVTRMDLATSEMEFLTPDTLQVSEFAIAADGNTLALIVQDQVENVQMLRLFLMSLAGDGELREVPAIDTHELFLFPDFK